MGAGASNSRKAVTAKQTSAADVRTLSQRNVHAGRVATAIQQAEAVIQKYHPLRNFGCVMTVALVHHSKPASIDSQRKLVELRDTLRWREFNEWVQVTLWGVMDVKKGDKLRFEYYDELGIACQINDERDMSRWMDVMWCHHPLELHVYEPGAAPMRTPEQLRLETAEKLFKAFDVDGSGSISDEEQLMARELSEVYDADPSDVANFLTTAFKAADADSDTEVTRTEFMEGSKHVSDAMMAGFVRGSGYRRRAAQARALASRTWRRTLEWVANQKPRHVSDATSLRGGRLDFNANPGADHGVELRIPKAALSDANKGKWVQASTVSEELVDSFEDPTDRVGTLCSPLLLVEFEPGTVITSPYEVTLPHCFDLDTAEGDPLEKTDIVVAFSTLRDVSWQVLQPEEYTLNAPTDPESTIDGALPSLHSVTVKMRQGGVIGLFADSAFPLAQRVTCVSYIPHRIIPLESDTMRIYVIPDLPHAVAAASHTEAMRRGLVVLAGACKPFRVLVDHEIVRVHISDARSDGGGGGGAAEMMDKELWWDGTSCVIDFDFDPEHWLTEGDVATAGAAGDALAKYKVHIEHTSMLGRRRRPKKADGAIDFLATATIHCFPVPSAPLNVRVVSRTLSSLTASWEPPGYWGGCALASYEMELREISGKGVEGEWKKVAETSGEKTVASANMQIFKAEIRVRAYNVGSREPGPWSESWTIQDEATEKDLEDARYREKLEFTLASNRAKRKLLGRAASAKLQQAVTSEEGVAVITSTADDDKLGRKFHQWKASDKMGAEWTPFARVIGEFFLEAGVEGGVDGTLFDLRAQQVEKLYSNAEKEASDVEVSGVGENEPLIALATSGIWVMETLAHHTENPEEWIRLINQIDGLIHLAAYEAIGELDAQSVYGGNVDVSTKEQVRQILYVLIRVYESLRQCSSGGYITSQLTHRYNKASRDNLRKEWNEYQRSLVHEVGEHVLSITTHARSFAVGKLSPTETVLLSKMMNLHHSDGSIAPPGFDYGAIGYRVRSFQARSTKPPPWMIAPKPTKAVLFTAMRVSGLPNPRDGADGPQLAISVHTPDGKTSTGRSLSAAHKMDPMWSNECLELELGNVADETSAIAADCTVQVDVLRPSRHGSTHCLGTVSFKMRATAGRFEGELLDPNGKQTSSRLYVSYQSPHAVTN